MVLVKKKHDVWRLFSLKYMCTDSVYTHYTMGPPDTAVPGHEQGGLAGVRTVATITEEMYM